MRKYFWCQDKKKVEITHFQIHEKSLKEEKEVTKNTILVCHKHQGENISSTLSSTLTCGITYFMVLSLCSAHSHVLRDSEKSRTCKAHRPQQLFPSGMSFMEKARTSGLLFFWQSESKLEALSFTQSHPFSHWVCPVHGRNWSILVADWQPSAPWATRLLEGAHIPAGM